MIPSDDPAHDWDVYCDGRERAYKALIDGKACGDCSNCEEPDDAEFDNPTGIGWCKKFGELVGLGELVANDDCGGYEERTS